ncbi:MAG: ABC transporter permease [Clostridia bacterium]|jgi:peptide/nickel transport system permease protein|nr:ABC transporter permease [Clostridia bacterium]MBT7121993.1 ABC transporter permease [Clostridia bacterium]
MKRLNTPLIIGCIILILILIVMLFPNLLTDKSPYNLQRLIFSYDETGSLIVDRAPFAPSGEFILGSDDMGRDIYSYILFGTRLTVLLGLLVALGSFAIAVPLAISAGFGHKVSKFIIKKLNIVFSAIPAVIFSFIILKFDMFAQMDRARSIISFVVVLSFVGWPKLGHLIMERVEAINRQPFIKSEVAIGKKRSRIAVENVIPHLAPELIVLYFMEIARSLSLIMKLGIFSVFVGNLQFVASTDFGNVTFFNISFEPEWASMLSTSRSLLGVAPWAVLFPALAFFISVLGFNLFGEGLRKVMQKKDSNIIPTMRKILTFDFVGMWRNFGKSSKVKVAVTVVLIASLILPPYLININKYKVNKVASYDMEYEQVLIGTPASGNTATIITDKMRELNVAPIEGDSYFINYEIEASSVLVEHTFRMSTKSDVSLKLNEDYAFISSGAAEISGIVYDATKDDLFNGEGYSKYIDSFVLIDKQHYQDAAIEYIIKSISSSVNIKGFILVARDGEEVSNLFVEQSEDFYVVLVSVELAVELAQNSRVELDLSATLMPMKNEGTNIVGIYKNENWTQDSDAILIGLNYNYLIDDGNEVLQFNLNLMEVLCASYDKNKALIFMFLDGTQKEVYNGTYPISEDFPYSSAKVRIYFDLTDLEKAQFDQIVFSAVQAPITRQYAWSIAHQFEKGLNQRGILYEGLETIEIENEHYYVASDADNAMFWTRGIASIIIGSGEQGEGKHSIYEIGSILFKVINEIDY